MKNGQQAKAFFSPIYSKAAHDYVCDGCLGEYPIRKGDRIMKHKVMTHDRKFETLVYCPRCKMAIQSKIAHNGGKPVALQKGDLVWNKLSNGFRKAWRNMCMTWDNLKKKGEATDENWSKVIGQFIKESGCESFYDPEKYAQGVREAAALRHENRRKLLSMRRAFDETKKELEALRKQNKSLASKAKELCDQLAMDRLGLFNAKTDEERGEWKQAFIADLSEMRKLADELAETAMEE